MENHFRSIYIQHKTNRAKQALDRSAATLYIIQQSCGKGRSKREKRVAATSTLSSVHSQSLCFWVQGFLALRLSQKGGSFYLCPCWIPGS